MAKTKIPAMDGWFTLDEAAPALIGTRCKGCGTYFFPKETVVCRNPRCFSTELEEVELSRRGRVWSFTNNCYPPPEPYVASDPFEPYAIAAVELEAEKMVVLGQLADGAPRRRIGLRPEGRAPVRGGAELVDEPDDAALDLGPSLPTGPAPIVESRGRLHPVTVRHLEPGVTRQIRSLSAGDSLRSRSRLLIQYLT